MLPPVVDLIEERQLLKASHSICLCTGRRFEVVNKIILVLFQYVHKQPFCLLCYIIVSKLDVFILIVNKLFFLEIFAPIRLAISISVTLLAA